MSSTPNDKSLTSDADERVDVTKLHAAILREQNEPEDGYEALPTIWLMCMLALALIAGGYFGSHTAGFSAAHLDGDAADTLTNAVAAAPPPAADPKIVGKRIYNNCMACHQADGHGVSGQFPPLAQSEWVLGKPEALARILLHGLQGEVHVLGKSYNGVMPAWQRLPDSDIAAVLTYIRGAFGNKADPIEADLIAHTRELEGAGHGPWDTEQLRKLGLTP